MNKRSYLLREYARVIDMCEGTSIEPESCIKLDDIIMPSTMNPTFKDQDTKYTFAITILENKPVFNGDVIWSNKFNRFYTVVGFKNKFDDSSSKPIGNFLVAEDQYCLPSISTCSWEYDPYFKLKNDQENGRYISWYNPITESWNLQLTYISDEMFKKYPVEYWKSINKN